MQLFIPSGFHGIANGNLIGGQTLQLASSVQQNIGDGRGFLWGTIDDRKSIVEELIGLTNRPHLASMSVSISVSNNNHVRWKSELIK